MDIEKYKQEAITAKTNCTCYSLYIKQQTKEPSARSNDGCMVGVWTVDP